MRSLPAGKATNFLMIAIIGDRESVLPFKAFGVVTFEAGELSEGQKIIDSIKPGEYEIVFIAEELMQGLKELGVDTASMVAIPGRRGSLGYGKLILKEIIKKAIGAEVE